MTQQPCPALLATVTGATARFASVSTSFLLNMYLRRCRDRESQVASLLSYYYSIMQQPQLHHCLANNLPDNSLRCSETPFCFFSSASPFLLLHISWLNHTVEILRTRSDLPNNNHGRTRVGRIQRSAQGRAGLGPNFLPPPPRFVPALLISAPASY